MPGSTAGEFVGNSLLAVDESSIAHIPGIVAVVVIRDFVGIVAMREEQAIKAAQRTSHHLESLGPGTAGHEQRRAGDPRQPASASGWCWTRVTSMKRWPVPANA
jgi:hypothetical protein